ncbi:MAG: helix-turn-helix domain-containing protein [Candidatus Methylomirabilales bacterium]
MLKVEDWAEIRRLYRAEGLSIKEIVRRLGVARNTVRAVVRSEGPPAFNRKPRPSATTSWASFRSWVRFPRGSATKWARPRPGDSERMGRPDESKA